MIWGIILDLHAVMIFAAAAVFVLVRPPPAPLRPVLLWVQIAAAVWILGDLGTLLARDAWSEQASISLLYAGSLALPPLWWLLALGFGELHGVAHAWVTPTMRRSPLIAALVVWVIVATNPWHGQFLTPVIGSRNDYHWLWWTTIPVFYLIAFAVLALYLDIYRRLPRNSDRRRQCRLMIIATVTGLVTNGAYTLAPVEWPFDITIFCGLLTGLLFLGGIYSRSLVDIPSFALREVLRGDPTGLLLVKPDGTLSYANPRALAMLGDPPVALDRDAWELLSARLEANDGVGQSPMAFEEAIREDNHRGALYRLSESKPSQWLWLTAARLPARRGAPGDVAVRLRDVSRLQALVEDQRAISEQLRSAQGRKAMGVLTAGIAHEINNPIGSLLMSAQYAEHARQEEADPAARTRLARGALDDALAETERARRILESMLRFAENDPGSRTEGDLNESIRQASSLTGDLTSRLRARISLELADTLPAVRMNTTEMEQVFVNLIQNAMQSGGIGRTVEIRTEPADGCVRAIVSDDGPGMTAEQVARAFEPFQTWRRELGGTGLGLSVVHGIVEAHGGRTRIDSKLGRGARVVIELPIAEAQG